MSARRHHYLPQFYLEGFGDPNTGGKIWQYDKESLRPMALYASSIAVRPNLYRLTNADGTPDPNSLEQAFCQVEGNFATLKRKLGEKPQLAEEDLSTFLVFAALMKARVPYHLDIIAEIGETILKVGLSTLAANKQAFDHCWEQMLKDLGPAVSEVSKEELRQQFIAGVYNPQITQEEAVRMALRTIQTIHDSIRDIRWRILTTTQDAPFVTCDNPFFYDDPTADPRYLITRGVGLLNRNVEIILPLSSTLVILGNRSQPEHTLAIPPLVVNQINLRMVACSQRFVYAGFFSDTLERFVKGQTTDADRLWLSITEDLINRFG
jgi:hypothetical protein